MATYQDLLPEILPEVTGCPQTIAVQKLRDTVRHFCRESWYWQANIEPITLLPYNDLVSDSYAYRVTAGEAIETLGVVHLLYKGKDLPSGVETAMDSYCPGWREEVASDPRMYLTVGPAKVRFVPASDEVQAIAVTGRAAVAPTHGATEFGDELMRFSESLCAGALARLQKMVNKEWSSPQSAQMNQGIYQDGLSQAKLEALREHQSDSPTVNPIPFF